MFCAECGTKNDASARYCENCGALLVSNEIVSDIIHDYSNLALLLKMIGIESDEKEL